MTLEIDDTEKYADEIDRAAAIANAHNEACVDSARMAMRPQQEPDEHGRYPVTDCAECGEDIPVERLRLGRIYCVDCQDRMERRGRFYAR